MMRAMAGRGSRGGGSGGRAEYGVMESGDLVMKG